MQRDPNVQSPRPLDLTRPKDRHHPPQQNDRQPAASLQPSQNTGQRQRRKTQQPKLPPLIISGNTTDLAAVLAPAPRPIVDLPASSTKSARIKEDRPGKRAATGLNPGPGVVSFVADASPAGAATKPIPVKDIETSLRQTNKNPRSEPKVVTFLQPTPSLVEDRESVCQSPSWEAYGRRKKEKKEKELADRETKSKKRRLTKTKVPPSPTSAAAALSSSTSTLPVRTSPHEAASSQRPTQAQTPSCMSDPRPRQSQPQFTSVADRSAGDMALYNTDLPLDVPTPHTPRGRSGSFSSLFKSPFEFRRPSIDQERERQTGFIGGIKLEQHRTAAYQKTLEDALIGPEGDIHPAFRRERRSSSPLRFFTPRHTSHDAEDRRYPPNTIKTSGNQALIGPEPSDPTEGGMIKKWRDRVGLKGSSKGSGSDTETGDKKQRRRRLSKTSAQRDDSATRTAHSKSVSVPALSIPDSTSSKALDLGQAKRSAGDSSGARETTDKPAEYVDNRLNFFLPPISPLSTHSIVRDVGNVEQNYGTGEPSPLTSDDTSYASYMTPDEVPPPPPRKSSKRKSLVSLSDASLVDILAPSNALGIEPPPVITNGLSDSRLSSTSLAETHTHKQPNEDKQPGRLSKINRQSILNPPSISYDSLNPVRDSSVPPKRTLREAARAAFGRPASSASVFIIPNISSSRPSSRSKSPYNQHPTAGMDTRPSSTTNVASARDSTNLSKPARVLGEVDWRTGYLTTASPPTNSSEDSASDDGHAPDTPDTSRPQSERGPSFDPGDGKRGRNSIIASGLPSPAFSHTTEPRKSIEKPNTVELDNVQAAAMKVMAAFPDPLPKRPDGDWRSQSDSNLTANYLPKMKHQSVQSSPRERNKPRPIKTDIAPVNDTESKSPPLRDLLMSKDESAATAPWPATYLEAARKAAPAAPAPKTLKEQASASTPNLAPPRRINPSNRSRQSSPTPSNLSHQRIRHAATTSTSSVVGAVEGEPIAKMFVECCACKYYHDMPSKLYEAMARPEGVVPLADNVEFAGAVSMTVKCSWCKHEMSTKCCAGLAAMVYVKERLH